MRTDYLSLVLTPLRIRWTIPLNCKKWAAALSLGSHQAQDTVDQALFRKEDATLKTVTLFMET